ncbi:hypothetical protein D3C72_2024710 [compost metagenome]
MFPGVAVGFGEGSNCQHFCYELLRHFSYQMGNLRSDELWADTEFSKVSNQLQPLDLILFNGNKEAYGAHVGICIGENQILHLSKKIAKPIIWSLAEFQEKEEYKELIGIKRPIRKLA